MQYSTAEGRNSNLNVCGKQVSNALCPQPCTASTSTPCDLPPCTTTRCEPQAWDDNQCKLCKKCNAATALQTRAVLCKRYSMTCDNQIDTSIASVTINEDLCVQGQQGLRVVAPTGCGTVAKQQPCAAGKACESFECKTGTATQCVQNCAQECPGYSTVSATIHRIIETADCLNPQRVPISAADCANNPDCSKLNLHNTCLPQYTECTQTCCSHVCKNDPIGACSVTCGSGFKKGPGFCEKTCNTCTTKPSSNAAGFVTTTFAKSAQVSREADHAKCPGTGGSGGLRVQTEAKCPEITTPCTLCQTGFSCNRRRSSEQAEAVHRAAPLRSQPSEKLAPAAATVEQQDPAGSATPILAVLGGMAGVIALIAGVLIARKRHSAE